MKKLSNATLAAATHPRAMARVVLAFIASVLVVLLGSMGTTGPNGPLVFAQEESPSPTEDTTGPSVELLNPNETYAPVIFSSEDAEDPPKISDRYDGSDTAYHVVAVTRQAPAGAVLEAYWQRAGDAEQTVGPLTRVGESQDTWELFWDIPADWSEGDGEFKVRMFEPNAAGGFDQLDEDVVVAELRHEGSYNDGDDQPAENTVEITWPTNAGELGFHKPRGGSWRTWINGTSSMELAPTGSVIDTTVRVRLFYTVTPIGQQPEFKECGEANPDTRQDDSSEFWATNCTLTGKDLPSQVTGVAAVGTGFERPFPSGLIAETTQESADAHRVRGFVQDVRRMNVSIEGVPSGSSASYPTGQRRTADSDCLEFDVTVTDHLDRPVQGANVDVHLLGPTDQAGFGDEGSSSHGSSGNKTPDKGTHTNEPMWNCDSPGNRDSEEQGEHNIPGGPDRKHVESTSGTGLSGPSGTGPGQFRFHIYSPDPGRSTLVAWVDDMPLTSEGETREPDDDLRRSEEPSASISAQWFPEPMTASLSPRADSAIVGECNRYVLRVRAGTAVVDGINVDVHATGPNNDLDFCDPGDGTPRRAPDQPEGDDAHAPEDEGEASHNTESPEDPRPQHTEGETDTNGNFIFGISSPVSGSTQIEAWVDGERGQDNDVKNSGEVSATASKNWAASAHDAEVRFVNPSGYGGSGDTISNKTDVDDRFHLVARVDLPEVVEGVDFFAIQGSTATFLGRGARVGTSDAWELFTSLPDGSYTLRAQIVNTEKREDRAVTVDNSLETAELTRPPNGGAAPFSGGETDVAGVASADAEGVEFFYTKTDARETRNAAQWVSCGETELPTADGPQNFEGKCALQEGDAALQVTGIAALTWACDPLVGCSFERTYQTGDAHRVFGFEANPNVTIEPAETSSATGECQRLELTVTDAVGRAIPNANVDVHLTGPTDEARFCELADGSPRRAPTEGGHAASTEGESAFHQNTGPDTHHTEGESDEGGKFIFGVRSDANGDSQVVGWADQNDNDELDGEEKSDTSVVHWGTGGGGGGGGGRGCTIVGTSGPDTLRGTPGDDVICARGGRDSVRGRGGNDVIYGGGGHDDIRGNAGHDKMFGGGGLDVLRGGYGADRIRGGSGNDTMRGYVGRDRMFGGGGDDVIAGGRHADYLRGGPQNDSINGGRGRDNCAGNRGRDSLTNCER